jgi:hypothetical protein
LRSRSRFEKDVLLCFATQASNPQIARGTQRVPRISWLGPRVADCPCCSSAVMPTAWGKNHRTRKAIGRET